MASVKISTTISEEFRDFAKRYHIKYSEAIRVGMAILLAEKGVVEYDNTLILHRKMRAYQTKAEECMRKMEHGAT